MSVEGSFIREVFEQREREFLLSPVRVTMRASIENLEAGEIVIRAKEGESLEFPRWIAEELSELNLGEMMEESFEVEISKSLMREKIMGPSQLSPLQPSFYTKMRRRLKTVREGSESGRYKREDYEKLRATSYDLIGRRLSKLLATSPSTNIQTIADRITPEEREFFASSKYLSDEWKKALLGD